MTAPRPWYEAPPREGEPRASVRVAAAPPAPHVTPAMLSEAVAYEAQADHLLAYGVPRAEREARRLLARARRLVGAPPLPRHAPPPAIVGTATRHAA